MKSEGLQKWEVSDFPITCEKCLGDNPYLRMSKANFDEECKICAKPFTVFRWIPGKRERSKKTEICQICAKLKNLCQSCILDLQYKAPFEIRDALLEGWHYTQSRKPQTEVHREYFALQAQKKVEQNQVPDYTHLPKLNMTIPTLPSVTSYIKNDKGEIMDTLTQNETNTYNYFQFNTDPNRPVIPKLNFPSISEEITAHNPYATDPNNKTVFVGGIDNSITEEDLRNHFASFGPIIKIFISGKSNCAFIDYANKDDAIKAIDEYIEGTKIRDVSIRVCWGKNK